jgi:CrcB protein
LAETINTKNVAVVGLGGIIGSLSRWGVSLGIQDHGFPWATLIVNYIGSAILMALVVFVNHHPNPRWWWRPALGAGFCGGFTTYSAFAVKVDEYFRLHEIGRALSYMTASIVGTYIIVVTVHKIATKRAGK